MNISKSGRIALLTSCFVCLSFAENRPEPRSPIEPRGVVTEKSAETFDIAVTPVAKTNGAAAASAGSSEIYVNVVIPAGKTVSFDSTLDYSSASTVAVTVLCNICTTAVTALGNSGLVLQARWTVPDAASYGTAENKAASAFPYSDSGGALFNVYGTQFRLALQNKGNQTIALQQVTIFRRGQ